MPKTLVYDARGPFRHPATWRPGDIALEPGGSWAPCCYILCRLVGEPGSLDWDERDEGNTRLVQTDWDWPGVASSFGWSPCDCGATDGTVDCAHKTASAMIADAGAFLDDVAGAFVVVDDPGYF